MDPVSLAVEICRLSTSLAATPTAALHHVSLAIPVGQVIGILGGAHVGKSALLQALAGSLPAESGSVVLGGVDLAARRAQALAGVRAALLPAARPEGDPKLLDYVSADAQVSGAQAERMLRSLGLWRRRRERMGRLSAALRHAVGVVRAVAASPPILLLDEPGAGLAPAAAQTLEGQIAEHARSAASTVVVATARLDLARRLCDRYALLDAGRLVAELSSAELAEAAELGWYTIVVRGYVEPRWSERLSGLAIHHESGMTTLSGILVDQVSLNGILNKIYSLGLTLVSVRSIPMDAAHLGDYLARRKSAAYAERCLRMDYIA